MLVKYKELLGNFLNIIFLELGMYVASCKFLISLMLYCISIIPKINIFGSHPPQFLTMIFGIVTNNEMRYFMPMWNHSNKLEKDY